MNYRELTLGWLLLVAGASLGAGAAETVGEGDPAGSRPRTCVYGEWRIHVRPDKVNEYERLIATQGLPLFQKAGGRMVGWWKTLIGDLYEQVTVWEYDDMAAFERAIDKLGADEQFSKFVAERDPLLAGESSRFLTLTDFSVVPNLDEPAKFVVLEVHHVLRRNRDAYLRFMQRAGLALLRHHGFDPVGPWIVAVGDTNEVTYLFRYKSLRERDERLAALADHPDVLKYRETVGVLAEGVTTRVLIPAPFAARPPEARP